MMIEIKPPESVNLDRYLSDPFAGSIELPAKIADVLRGELRLDVPNVKSALITYLQDRISRIEGTLRWMRDDCFPALTPADTLRIVQVPESVEIESIEDLRLQRVPYSLGDLARWKKQAAAIEVLNDRSEMFIEFARIEEEFEPLEKQVDEVANYLDRLIQQRMDELRGK